MARYGPCPATSGPESVPIFGLTAAGNPATIPAVAAVGAHSAIRGDCRFAFTESDMGDERLRNGAGPAWPCLMGGGLLALGLAGCGQSAGMSPEPSGTVVASKPEGALAPSTNPTSGLKPVSAPVETPRLRWSPCPPPQNRLRRIHLLL